MIQLLTGIQSTAAALDAERTRLNVISENIANANTAHGVDGKPYQRQVVVFESALKQAMNNDGTQPPALQVARIEKDSRPPLEIYSPGQPQRRRQRHGRHAEHQHPRGNGRHDFGLALV